MSSSIDKVSESVHPDQDDTSTDSSLRYAAYANRLRTIVLASHRYVAYTSDIGESFRPVVNPAFVKLCYGISWSYVLGDVSLEAWRARMRQEGRYTPGLLPWHTQPDADPVAAAAYNGMDWKWVGLQRGVFQSIASMGLPAFTIHSTVRYSSVLFKNSSNKSIKTFGPVGLGLAVVPLLPYLFDEPVEHATEYIFEQAYKALNSK
ncbi:hypothetical protein OGAPHI_002756 [Ogataea philodendri]|uniref:Mitochondrial fission process protein 1 n=1 Tax=Ogataea philodendri TaxID=1378263 RepID=A0A9P8T7N2_9ASCO|nr:uncharacterized protein OGAPHI_002756 [Ogataea philodendri]KAH3669001.1 hypothetical protein OGAPHI_002756 [Ogataea philodendri]